jgi:predicted RNase H-like HicB family nuclease
MKYAVVFEKGERNWSAFVPDLPGCIATGRTRPETAKNIRAAIALHLAGMREDGLPIPKPVTGVAYILAGSRARAGARRVSAARARSASPTAKSRSDR